MARENQGLQIALIIFVMLTIVLGVTTFIFFRRYDETMADAKAKTEQATKASTDLGNEKAEKEKLKKLLGFPETDKIDTIEEQSRADFTPYRDKYPEENLTYRQLVKDLHDQIGELNKLLADEKDEVQTLKDQNERRIEEIKPQIEVASAARDKAAADLEAERKQYNDAASKFGEQQNKLAAALEKARKEGEAQVAKLQGQLEEVNLQIQRLNQLNVAIGKKLDDVVKETFEVADGEVTWVNQRNGTVWVSLGRADGLRRQTSFAVYASDTNDVSKAGKKGSVEVTQIWGDHVAEARIVEDLITDPIMPGDKIHTPIWSPGERRRFALTGDLDLDGDGKSDLQKVLNLISLNGGLVDCYLDDKTPQILTGEGKPGGKIDLNTRFLVVGAAPEGAASRERLDSYSRMIGEARKIGIKEIPLKELLFQMGWRESTPVVTFGPGANPADFRPLPQEGVAPVSGGDVSGLFRDRPAPPGKPSPRSAF